MVRVRAVALYERDVVLRMPFRFGVVTLRAAPQAFARVRIELADGRTGFGMAAEMLAPKWFDKNPALSNEDNFVQLRCALHNTADAYLAETRPQSPFVLSAGNYRSLLAAGAAQGLNPLVANFGPALIDRAVIDAVCRVDGLGFAGAVRANRLGIAAMPVAPDLGGFDLDRFLAGLHPRPSIHARHTVGLVDPVTAADRPAAERVNDGLPETLEEVVAAYGHRYFKLKVGGKAAEDVARLAAIAGVLDRAPEPYFVTLDGNEQYADVEGVIALWQTMRATPALDRLCRSILFVEQPIRRDAALARDIGALAELPPVIIDESDSEYDTFAAARRLGYRGVSSKTCKGVYRSLLNAARCRRWNDEAGAERFLMSGEDLTTQAGLAVQQDLALVAVLGLGHVERNGHHYVDGFAAASPVERAAFLAAHPDLYHRAGDNVRLTIREGRLALGSILACAGFASAAEPDWSALRPMPKPAAAPQAKGTAG
jgi:hypothetical protein